MTLDHIVAAVALDSIVAAFTLDHNPATMTLDTIVAIVAFFIILDVDMSHKSVSSLSFSI
jgi:formate hydrogenlyase subunit 4